jgi:molybdopterin/thiamine biosynthesis adenylyltransferase
MSSRFARQLALPGMTEDSQKQLASAHVILLGLSSSASACAIYLVEAGIGHLTLVDQLRIDESDLNEQLLFQESNIGEFKVDAAKNYLLSRNSKLVVDTVKSPFNAHSAETIIAKADIVVDALEDWQSKLVASDICMQLGRTLVHAHIHGFEFHIYTMIPGRSACLRCVLSKTGLEDLVSTSAAYGTLGPLSGMAGCFQAIEVIKLVTGLGTTPGNHLIKFDSLRRDFDDVTDLGPRPDCPDCGRPF